MFYPLNQKKDPMNGYIKDDQQYNNVKRDLLKIKGIGKDNFIRQIDKDNGKKLKYFLKNNEKKSKSKNKELNLINNNFNFNKNGMPIKLLEFDKKEKKQKNNIIYHENIEDMKRIKNEDLMQKLEKQRNDENIYNSNKYIKMNDIMIKASNNLKENDLFSDEFTEFKEKKTEKIFTNLKINKNQKIEIQALNKNSKNLFEFERELKKKGI
jgi:hypothetical protein